MFSPGDREIEGEGGAFVLAAFHVNITLMIFNRSPHHGHSQSSSAAAHLFLGVKRLEDALQILGGNSMAGIANF